MPFDGVNSMNGGVSVIDDAPENQLVDDSRRQMERAVHFRGENAVEFCKEKLTLGVEDYKHEPFHKNKDIFIQTMWQRVAEDLGYMDEQEQEDLRNYIEGELYDQYVEEHVKNYCQDTIKESVESVKPFLELSVEDLKSEAFHKSKDVFMQEMKNRVLPKIADKGPEMQAQILEQLQPTFEKKYQYFLEEHVKNYCQDTIKESVESVKPFLELSVEDLKSEPFHKSKDAFMAEMRNRVLPKIADKGPEMQAQILEQLQSTFEENYQYFLEEHVKNYCQDTIKGSIESIKPFLELSIDDFKNEGFHKSKDVFMQEMKNRVLPKIADKGPEMQAQILEQLAPIFEEKYKQYLDEHVKNYCQDTIKNTIESVTPFLELSVEDLKSEPFHKSKDAFMAEMRNRVLPKIADKGPEMQKEILKQLQPVFEEKYKYFLDEHVKNYCTDTIRGSVESVKRFLELSVEDYKEEKYHKSKDVFMQEMKNRVLPKIADKGPEMQAQILEQLAPIFEEKYKQYLDEHVKNYCQDTIKESVESVKPFLELSIDDLKNESFHKSKDAFMAEMRNRVLPKIADKGPEMQAQILEQLQPVFEEKYAEFSVKHMDYCQDTLRNTVETAQAMMSLSRVDASDESLSNYEVFRSEMLGQAQAAWAGLTSEPMKQAVKDELESHIQGLHSEWMTAFEAEQALLDQDEKERLAAEKEEAERLAAEKEAEEAEQQTTAENSPTAETAAETVADSIAQSTPSDLPVVTATTDAQAVDAASAFEASAQAFDTSEDAASSSADDAASATGEDIVPGRNVIASTASRFPSKSKISHYSTGSSVASSTPKNSEVKLNASYPQAGGIVLENHLSETGRAEQALVGDLLEKEASATESAAEYSFLMEPELKEFLREKQLLNKPELFELLDELFPLACREYFSNGHHLGMEWLKMKDSQLFHRFSSFLEKNQKRPDELFEMLRFTWGKPKYGYLKGSFMPAEEVEPPVQAPLPENSPAVEVKKPAEVKPPEVVYADDVDTKVDELSFAEVEDERTIEVNGSFGEYLGVASDVHDEPYIDETDEALVDYEVDGVLSVETLDENELLEDDEVLDLDEGVVLFDETDLDEQFADLEGVIFDEDDVIEDLEGLEVEADELNEEDLEQDEDFSEKDELPDEAEEQDAEGNELLDAIDESVFQAIGNELEAITLSEDILSLLSMSASAEEFFEAVKQNTELMQWLDLMKRRYGLSEMVLYLLLKEVLQGKSAEFVSFEKGRESDQMIEMDVEVTLSLHNIFRTVKRSLNDVGCELIWNFSGVSDRVYALSEKVLQAFKYNLENNATRHHSYLIELDTENGLYIKVRSVALEINSSRVSPKEIYNLPLRRELS